MKRKILALILCIMLVLPCMNMGVSAAQNFGKCGDNVTWSVSNCVLTISGSGDMYDYESASDLPWDYYKDAIVGLVIEDGVTSIGNYAFSSLGYLMTADISTTVTSIGEFAFAHCYWLYDFTIPDSITTIEMGAFQSSGITSITIPTSITTIEQGAFSGCGDIKVYYLGTETQWNSVTIKPSNAPLVNATFNFNHNVSWSFDETTQTVTIRGNGVMMDLPTHTSGEWKNTGMKSVVIEEGIAAIGRMAFSYCANLTNVSIPNTVTSIGNSAFAYCTSLTSITIPESVTTIGSGALACCSSLTKVVIPVGVKTIKEETFVECTALKDVYYGGTEAQWKAIRVEGYNEPLRSARIHFESDGSVNSSELFTDVPANEWYKKAVDYVVDKSLMNGVGDGTRFDPNGSMTRAMIVTVLYRLEGSPKVNNTTPFTDLKADWYKDAVAWAYKTGVVTGTSASTFSPDGNVTREQIATILYRYADYKGYNVSATADLTTFPDSANVNAWAKEAMQWANGGGLITGATQNGTTVLAPQGEASRAQVATILMRFCEM